jgi:hypothetical protein
MNAQFFTHDLRHLMSYYATHPIALFLNSLAALQIRAIARYGCGLRLARASQNSALGCVQLPVQAHHPINPKFGALKAPRLGKTSPMSLADTPNQRAKVAAYWSTEVVGMVRPEPTSSLLFKPMIGNLP